MQCYFSSNFFFILVFIPFSFIHRVIILVHSVLVLKVAVILAGVQSSISFSPVFTVKSLHLILQHTKHLQNVLVQFQEDSLSRFF